MRDNKIPTNRPEVTLPTDRPRSAAGGEGHCELRDDGGEPEREARGAEEGKARRGGDGERRRGRAERREDDQPAPFGGVAQRNDQ